MIDWDAWEYRTVSADLEMGTERSSRPEYWRTGIRSIEATVQTLLGFHLETFTGLPLRLVRSAGALDSSADLVATDALRRVHLFELKQKAINEQAASQLEKYMLRHVFADPSDFVAAAEARGRSQFIRYEVAKDILGFHANERPELLGLDLVRRRVGDDRVLGCDGTGHRLTPGRWRKLSDDEKLIRLHASLRSRAHSNRSTVLPPLGEIVEVAEGWSQHLLGSLAVGNGNLVAERPLVVWLVGSSVTPQADERIRLWRRAGIDARALRMTARKHDAAWTIAVRREHAPVRDRAESELLKASVDQSSRGSVEIKFYEEVSASSNRRLGGGVLGVPKWKTKGR